jgi:predicted RecB family nuclease
VLLVTPLDIAFPHGRSQSELPMQRLQPGLRLSPSDLSGFLECRHRTGLDLAVASGHVQRPRWSDPIAQALRERGLAHEQSYVQSLEGLGLRASRVPEDTDVDSRVAATIDAMRSGVDVVVQGALASTGIDGTGEGWLGFADILRRVPRQSSFGAWSYEPYDTKLALETRGSTVLQLMVYVELLEQIQGTRPERFWVVAPGPQPGTFAEAPYRSADYAAYVRALRRQLAATVGLGHDAILAAHYPEPVDLCDVCRWWERCDTRRRADDHLSFIAGAGRTQRAELTTRGFPTLTDVAGMPVPVEFKPTRGSRETFERVGHQARVQHQQRQQQTPVHELLPVAPDQGLSRLPEPSPGDLFLDLEGARFAREGGREYLFGVWGRDGDAPSRTYAAAWAPDDAQERTAFEHVVDRTMSTLAKHPGAHVYHFGHYEVTAFKRLMGRYATRGEEMDELLRGGRFIDLHVVVRQAVRAGVESYSIKQLEQFYRFERAVPLTDASPHLHAVERALEGGVPQAIPEESRAAVQGYNEDDCRSTEALRDWLEGLRAGLVEQGHEIQRPQLKDADASKQVSELVGRQEAMRGRLLAGLPAEASQPEHPDHPPWLLAYLIDWHRREEKSEWWEYFRLRDLPVADLFDEPGAIAGLKHAGRVTTVLSKKGKPTGSVIDRYSYPEQEADLKRDGKLSSPGVEGLGDLDAHDRRARTIDIRKGPKKADIHPEAVFQGDVIPSTVLQEALLAFAERHAGQTCGADLLFRRPPRVTSGAFSPAADGDPVEFAVRVVQELDRTTFAIQGPPGAGKTYAGAQMILALVRAGKRVGVTAASHKVIRNLLEAIHAADNGIRLGHKCDPDAVEGCADIGVEEYRDNREACAAVQTRDVDVLGATAWFWAREDATGLVDVLVVDEAGQMSLANALAVSRAAASLVLLGDPQQLDQPQKGCHPDGVGVSALEHVLGGAATMPPERGLFLPTTWRLHPTICAFTSEVFYEGKLEPKPGLERQALSGTDGFDGAGLWWMRVEHDANQNASMEEVDAVERLVARLLVPEAAWIDADGVTRPMVPGDLRIVAPYNAQVNRLAERLDGRGIPVGTVDKFQGQEAPVVIYSMATSRPEDAPRGMEFLYSLNRLNVATSRARCAAILVASPHLVEPGCRTPRQMELANALCRYRELARRVTGI